MAVCWLARGWAERLELEGSKVEGGEKKDEAGGGENRDEAESEGSSRDHVGLCGPF